MQMFVDAYGRNLVKTSDITQLDIIDELEKAAREAEDFAAGARTKTCVDESEPQP